MDNTNSSDESNFDVGRMLAMMQNPHCNFDCITTFYYDETNNARRFYLKDDLFNSPFEANFVLGGVVGDANCEDVESLITSFNLQNNVSEVKFKNLAKGDFAEVLKSWRIQNLFQFILDGNLNIHYTTVNYLYWSIVDIIDSGILGSEDQILHYYQSVLKRVFYDICKLETADTVRVLKHFQYPNIKEADFEKFVYNINKILTRYSKKSEFADFIPLIARTLNQAAKNKKLPFITDEENYMLINDFSSFYFNPILMFKKSRHIFDNEEQIKLIFDRMDKKQRGLDSMQYEFIDSKTNRCIQISDAIVGFVGKLTQFVNQRSHAQAIQDVQRFDSAQIKTLQLFFAAFDKSMNINEGFVNHVTSSSDKEILGKIQEQVQK